MSYEPTNWKAGDTVTSAKLNKLEQGVAGAGVLVVNFDTETGALDKTWQEIHDAGFVVVKLNSMAVTIIGYVSKIEQSNDWYVVQIWMDEESILYATNSADGYPVQQLPLDPDPGSKEAN